MWRFDSAKGTFTISDEYSRYRLALRSRQLELYNSPQEAVDAVYMHATGDADWDYNEDLECPASISEWQET